MKILFKIIYLECEGCYIPSNIIFGYDIIIIPITILMGGL
jgi:hypothetical protein